MPFLNKLLIESRWVTVRGINCVGLVNPVGKISIFPEYYSNQRQDGDKYNKPQSPSPPGLFSSSLSTPLLQFQDFSWADAQHRELQLPTCATVDFLCAKPQLIVYGSGWEKPLDTPRPPKDLWLAEIITALKFPSATSSGTFDTSALVCTCTVPSTSKVDDSGSQCPTMLSIIIFSRQQKTQTVNLWKDFFFFFYVSFFWRRYKIWRTSENVQLCVYE